MLKTVLRGIATGNPELRKSQQFASEFMQKVSSLPAPIRNRIPAIYERSGIDHRFSAVQDYDRQPEDFDFYPKDWSLEPAPSTGQRNRLYRQEALPLAERVARQVLEDTGVKPHEITHVVAVTCTGFFAPGLDIELVKRLGLPADTRRAVIGFMGCYAALNGLRVADGFCQSHPGARVLLVCVELCTLHFQVADTMESAIVNSLFSDGAAAAILSSEPLDEARGELCYTDNHAVLDGDSMDQMTWEIGDTGFDMGLSPKVPAALARILPSYVETLLKRNAIERDDIGFWAIHPGGRAIVEKAQEVLDLSADDVAVSLDVLRRFGNMSSPTILFVLKEFWDRHRNERSIPIADRKFQTGLAMSFGPGLTLEGCLWTTPS